MGRLPPGAVLERHMAAKVHVAVEIDVAQVWGSCTAVLWCDFGAQQGGPCGICLLMHASYEVYFSEHAIY